MSLLLQDEHVMNPKDQHQQYRYLVKFAALWATLTALLLVSLKLYAWFVTGASAMLASATDSLLDLFASLMNVIILRFALAPADDKHKFGHGKAESLAGLVQSAFVLGSALLLIINGVERIITPKAIVNSEVGIIVSVAAIVLTLALVLVQHYVIKHTNSVAISADALHYRSDLALNIGVLLSLYLSESIFVQADGIFTLAVGAYLVFGALKILWVSVDHLMDKELSEQELEQITQIIQQHPHARGFHDLRTRQAGNMRFIQLHLELDQQLSLFDAHQIGVFIEKAIEDRFAPCEVLIHHDPVDSRSSYS
ncbi:cation diffusion facilitator family transporter [Thalassotalea ganghwensis]